MQQESQHPLLWQPDADLVSDSNLERFRQYLGTRGVHLPTGDYETLWQWSVDHLDEFWRTVLEYYPQVQAQGATDRVRVGDSIEDTQWFPDVKLNYAQSVCTRRTDEQPALIEVLEGQQPHELSWETLLAEVEALQQRLKQADVGLGDHVVAYVTNTREAIVGFLATVSLGAVWSSCSPDFGADAVLDRFGQLHPKVLLAVGSYGYGGRLRDRAIEIEALRAALPSVELAILIDRNAGSDRSGWERYDSVIKNAGFSAKLSFVSVPFRHPLWVLFSSGTTGKPKAIVHSHGGCLLEHLKYLDLQADVRPGERFFWFTTTGWMMWNFLQASMLVGAVPVLYDGSPGYPALTRLWKLAADLPIHHFGTSAPFIHACLKTDLDIREQFDLSALRSIGSTGAPLSEEGFAYVYERIAPEVWLTSMSGGTDVCTAFVGGNPWTSVRRGVIQGRALGCDLTSFDESGQEVVGEVGELVVRQAMPSMPIYFVDDEQHERRRASYFNHFEGVWRHGDWITLDEQGGVVIHGRSDATLNRQGVRIGTAEIYRVVAQFDQVVDSLIINYTDASSEDLMPLFVKMADGHTLDELLVKRLKTALREGNSPRHVPTEVIAVADIPYTISGKKLEAPVKKLFLGAKLEDVAKLGSLRNPDALKLFADLARSGNSQA